MSVTPFLAGKVLKVHQRNAGTRGILGEGIPDKGAQVPIGRSISDNTEDIHVRNRLNVSSIRSK